MLADGKDRLLGKLADLKAPEQVVEVAVRTILTRSATTEEKRTLTTYLDQRRDRLPEAYRQMVWAPDQAAEFRFNY